MDPYGNGNINYGFSASNASTYWLSPLTTATNPQISIYPIQPATDWERAAVKAEPDDEFSWLRKRIVEIEELAFA